MRITTNGGGDQYSEVVEGCGYRVAYTNFVEGKPPPIVLSKKSFGLENLPNLGGGERDHVVVPNFSDG